ncbi:hypothetical protein PMAYCL1PPCAC_23607, partial [Pristionchus mayeri]
MGSSSDGRSLEEVKQHQMDRLDEMQKLDGEVIGLNSAYIDILERITNKLDLLATLADEIESDTRSYPESMEDGLKMRFDLLTQSALMNRYMCSKALFQNAIGAIQAMNQFGCNYIDNRLIDVPVTVHQETNEGAEDISQAHISDVSGDTLASDSDATVAARMDVSDSQLSLNGDEVARAAGPSPSAPALLPSPVLPSTVDFEQGDIKEYLARELAEIREEEEKDRMLSEARDVLLVETPKDPLENTIALSSAQNERSVEWSQDCDERRSIADSFRSIESVESAEEKKRKRKKKKRSKSSEQRLRSKEAEKMENILNKHLKRSREKEPMKSKEEYAKKSPEASTTGHSIEVVTLSDDDHGRLVKRSKMEGDDAHYSPCSSSSRIIGGPMAIEGDENRENVNILKDEIEEMKNKNTPLSSSNQILSTIAHPPNVDVLSVPQPVPPPVTTPSLGRGPGFVAAAMEEAPITPSWSSLSLEKPTAADADTSVSEKWMMVERPESRGTEGGEDHKQERKKRKDSRCESRGSLKERLEEEIKLRESGRYTPDLRGRSRSLSYSPRRDRSRSRERSRSRSRERREWRWGASRFRYGYRPRYRRWSRSPTRSRSRSRHRSYSREREDWRDRTRSRSRSKSMSRSRSRKRSRSRSRSRSVSKGRSRSASPSIPSGRDGKSPMPRSYARFRNRSSERQEKKEREKNKAGIEKEEEEDVGMEGRVSSPIAEEVKAPTPSTPTSTLLPPPPPPFIPPYEPTDSLSPSSRPHSGSSSPSIFVPPPPILLPPKPPALKISIPSTLPVKKTRVSRDDASRSSSTSIDTAKPPPPPTAQKAQKGEQKACTLRRTLSDMSLEGNTVSEGSNGEEKRNKTKQKDGEECVPLAPPPSLPPLPPLPLFPPAPPIPGIPSRGMETVSLPETSAARVTSTVSKPSTVAVNRSNVNRGMNGPHPIYPLLGPNPHQFYPNVNNINPHNPYGPQNAWMSQDPQWHYFYNQYNADPAMMGAYGSPSSAHQFMAQSPIPEAPGSFINAMRVIPSPIGQQPPPDWAQMARDHANQQLLAANVPPPPPLNQQGIMMGHPLYGTPQSGRGGSRFRGGGGK